MTSQISIKMIALLAMLWLSFLICTTANAHKGYLLVEEIELAPCDNNVAYVYKVSPCRYRYWTKWNPINPYCLKRCLVDSWHYVIQCETRCS
ncbi:hypothetical protein [Legionella impletisoli]|uniref:Uncharacterized protein n=1 Tax=Legionella impletisoli TaxID=343510 RepID=A0A917ND05_9GAMM|nr:hypothetical protein [Legionella impletisoli]GGI88301.1 hypothetical protein GCM10007966_16330 [Legionella impletisoli]